MSEGRNQKLERRRSQYLSNCAFMIPHPARRTATAPAETPRARRDQPIGAPGDLRGNITVRTAVPKNIPARPLLAYVH
jgi:hypothetical protein